ncbi:MAG: type II toxin-antitoxin system HipA family toxin, partial [Gammaproteobacteria bacterium]
ALNGKRDKFELSDFLACSELISLRKGQAQQILEQVQKTVRNWPQFAEQAGVSPETTARITPAHRIQILT